MIWGRICSHSVPMSVRVCKNGLNRLKCFNFGTKARACSTQFGSMSHYSNGMTLSSTFNPRWTITRRIILMRFLLWFQKKKPWLIATRKFFYVSNECEKGSTLVYTDHSIFYWNFKLKSNQNYINRWIVLLESGAGYFLPSLVRLENRVQIFKR